MLADSIESDFKQAMKAKDELALSSLRNLKSEMKNVEIEKGKGLTEEDMIILLRRKIKQHKDSIVSFQTGGRQDLVEHEQLQLKVLEKYLPAQMPEDQVRELVKSVISQTSAQPSDFGKVMKEVLAKAAGQTDGSVVSKLVKEELK
jgi:hypothetical protein